MRENVVQMHPELPDDYCVCLDDLENQEEVKKMLKCIDDQIEEAFHELITDKNPVRGYINARNIMQGALDLLPLEETQKMLDSYFLLTADSRGEAQADIIEDYLKGLQSANRKVNATEEI